MSEQSAYLKTTLLAVVCFALHAGLWLLFVAKVSLAEGILALLASAFATLGAVAFAKTAGVRFRFSFGKLLQAWPIPLYVITGTFQVLVALARQLFTPSGAPSCLSALPYSPTDESPASRATRALAITCTTSTPNSIVLGIIKDQRLLLLHQVLPSDIHSMTRNLGAFPPRLLPDPPEPPPQPSASPAPEESP